MAGLSSHRNPCDWFFSHSVSYLHTQAWRSTASGCPVRRTPVGVRDRRQGLVEVALDGRADRATIVSGARLRHRLDPDDVADHGQPGDLAWRPGRAASAPRPGRCRARAAIRRSTCVTTNSRSSRAVHSLLTAERSSAAAAPPAGESQTLSTVRTSRSPSRPRSPASACGMISAGSIGGFMRAEEQLVLGAEVVVHQRRVDPGAGGDGADRRAVEAPLGERRRGRPPGSPPGCPGCRAAGRSAARPPSRACKGTCYRLARSRAHVGVRRRSVAAASTSATTTRRPRSPGRATSSSVGSACAPTSLQRLHRVRQRQHVADRLQPAGHLVARHEQPAQQELRHDHHRHELHGLELGAGEGAAEQAERHAEHRVGDGDQHDQPGAAGGVQAEQPVRHRRTATAACTAAARPNAMP